MWWYLSLGLLPLACPPVWKHSRVSDELAPSWISGHCWELEEPEYSIGCCCLCHFMVLKAQVWNTTSVFLGFHIFLLTYCCFLWFTPSLLMEEGDLRKEAFLKYSRNFRGETGFRSEWSQAVPLNNVPSVFYRHLCFIHTIDGSCHLMRWIKLTDKFWCEDPYYWDGDMQGNASKKHF